MFRHNQALASNLASSLVADPRSQSAFLSEDSSPANSGRQFQSPTTASMAAMEHRLSLSPSAELLGQTNRTALSSLASLSAALQLPKARPRQCRNPTAISFFRTKATGTEKMPADKKERPIVEEAKAQMLYVYEINERDRHSPAALLLARSPFNTEAPGLASVVGPDGNPVLAIGDLVPFSNKLYDGSLSLRLGITAGFSNVISFALEKLGWRYEAFYSFYFGDLGHISIQGPYLTYEDSELAVTGGSGIFRGVYGYVRLHQVIFPFKLFYTFYLFGIPKLPEILQRKHVEPAEDAAPTALARAAAPEACLPNHTK